jgi:hypothetical protein
MATSIAANQWIEHSKPRVAIPTSFLSAPFFGRAKKGANSLPKGGERNGLLCNQRE